MVDHLAVDSGDRARGDDGEVAERLIQGLRDPDRRAFGGMRWLKSPSRSVGQRITFRRPPFTP